MPNSTVLELTQEEIHMIVNALDLMYIDLKNQPYQIQRRKAESYAALATKIDLEAIKTSDLIELAENLIEDLQLDRHPS